MKHLKLYENFDENDPFGEEIEYVEPTFLNWLKDHYPYETKWNKIEVIDCNNNQLTSLEGVENLVGLRVLICYNNRLMNLDGIENLVGLRGLYCNNNNLNSLKAIENLVDLKWLYCHNNHLTSLEGIENLVKLENLCYSVNEFSNEYRWYLENYCKKNNIKLEIRR